MNILSFSELLGKTGKSKPVSASISAVKEGDFPLEIEGCEGAFGALLLAHLYRENPGLYFVVVPHEGDAAGFALDLTASGIPCQLFPWWGSVPYRELAPLSAVFGERVKVLSDLVTGRPGVIVVPQRAFLTPLPPPEYIKSLLVSVKQAGAINTTALVKTLSLYGYTRVPRVQVHGEFTLRGEVLDIFMSGDEAYRILFDFDKIESIKQFDPVNQYTENEKLPELLIRPMREVVWTDERIEMLEKNLVSFREFSDGGRSVIEELITRRGISGEEFFYPSTFEKAGTLLDYLGTSGILALVDMERLENAQESLVREYHSLYVRASRDASRDVSRDVSRDALRTERREYPLPERLLLDFDTMIAHNKRRISFKNIKSEIKPDVRRIDISCEPGRSFFGN
ncbi:MAG: transcription-repair coupling factor, partial [Treponema sp.]|nr:transcription-repair coupling factor [Treponema sp.]